MEQIEKDIILKKVEIALNSIRPFLQADGGDIEVLDLNDDLDLHVQLQGNCEVCPMNASTMKGGIEGTIRSAVPEINRIIPV
jgi:Fe-S cluster biogenesis protein NfuA